MSDQKGNLDLETQRPSPKSSPNNITADLHKHGYRMGSVLGEGSYSKVRLCIRYFADGSQAYRLACKVILHKLNSIILLAKPFTIDQLISIQGN